jgi:uroporphyrinogen III methyltransferase/synthase
LSAGGAGALAGRRVVITRAPEQAEDLMAGLARAGAEIISLPMVQFAETGNTVDLDRAIGELERFDWVIFTSANAVRFFFRRWRFLEVRQRLPNQPSRSAPQYAVVGAATRRALEEEDLRASYAPGRPGATGVMLAAELAGKVAGKRVLVPRSDLANGELLSALRGAEARVTAVEAYRTAPAESPDAETLAMLRQGDVDAITFFSPSAFHHFARVVGAKALEGLGDRMAVAAIGPTTAAAIREARVRVSVEAAEATADSLVAALERHFASQELQKGRD